MSTKRIGCIFPSSLESTRAAAIKSAKRARNKSPPRCDREFLLLNLPLVFISMTPLRAFAAASVPRSTKSLGASMSLSSQSCNKRMACQTDFSIGWTAIALPFSPFLKRKLTGCGKEPSNAIVMFDNFTKSATNKAVIFRASAYTCKSLGAGGNSSSPE